MYSEEEYPIEEEYYDDENINESEDEATDEIAADDSTEEERKSERPKRRYAKYRNVRCPNCHRYYYASNIRYTFIKYAIVYSCPVCKVILSINNKQYTNRT